ncbi:MAG: YigZ family protein [Moraxella sp.]|nr:YigZ family protein [Moraxella sp.]
MTYQTLSAPCQATYEIKKSTFLAFAYPIDDKAQIVACVAQLKQQYPDARHHCLAYILGDPHNTTHAGFDDDGEPNGTAGRPILSVLQHKAIGNVLVVVVRYFGGIKLGAGGLTRAYATATQMVVNEMTLAAFVPKTELMITTSFANEAQIRYLIAQAQGVVVSVDYATNVVIKVVLDSQKVDVLTSDVGILAKVAHNSH